MFQYIQRDLLEADTTYICHQCNCVTSIGKGLSADLFKKFPYANIYTERKSKDVSGHIVIKGNGKDQRFVINMLAQLYPGPAKFSNDSKEKRLVWFQNCLEEMEQLPKGSSFGFPDQIGCGLAGGDWEDYLELLQKFQKKNSVNVFIYKKTK
jgi:O-acetyl-ADP-ribose deacetylase (regulator of RNase III)